MTSVRHSARWAANARAREARVLLTGVAKRIPGAQAWWQRGKQTGGTADARYCYTVWMRHLSVLMEHGADPPAHVVEFGPGSTIGLGLAALLTGTERYFGVDIRPFNDWERCVEVVDGLVELLERRQPIPGDDAYPAVLPKLGDYAFPHQLHDSRLQSALSRAGALCEELRGGGGDRVHYFAPWTPSHAACQPPADVVISQATMEHVGDIEGAYGVMFEILRPGGLSSHTIDHRSHHQATAWNGHWAYPDWAWRLGGRSDLLNRHCAGDHIAAARRAGFEVVDCRRLLREDGLGRRHFAPAFQAMSEEDARTAGSLLVLRKPLPKER